MPKDPYLDENGVMKNLLGITNEKLLDQAEEDITYITTLTHREVYFDVCDYGQLLRIHKHIFCDIYEWAGQIRTIPIVKGERVFGGDTVRYSRPEDIEKDARIAIDEMNAINWNELNLDEKADILARLISRVWQSHPFREGNTRTVITFMVQFAESKGFAMDETTFRENPKYTRDALVASCDGQYSDFKHLIRIIKDAIEIGAKD